MKAKSVFFVVEKQTQRLIAGRFYNPAEATAWMTNCLTDEHLPDARVSRIDAEGSLLNDQE